MPGWQEVHRENPPKLIDALASGNPEQARETMMDHAERLSSAVLDHMQALGLFDEPRSG